MAFGMVSREHLELARAEVKALTQTLESVRSGDTLKAIGLGIAEARVGELTAEVARLVAQFEACDRERRELLDRLVYGSPASAEPEKKSEAPKTQTDEPLMLRLLSGPEVISRAMIHRNAHAGGRK